MDQNNDKNVYTNYTINPYAAPQGETPVQEAAGEVKAAAEEAAQNAEAFTSSPWSQPEVVENAAPQREAVTATGDKYNNYTYVKPQGAVNPYSQGAPMNTYNANGQANPYSGRNAYAQPQQNAYAQPQQNAYAQPQQNAYAQPQQNAYAQPQQNTYAQPQQNAYAQPQQNAYAQPQQNAYAQPQQNTYAQPQQNAYAQPQNAYTQPNYSVYGQPTYAPRNAYAQNVPPVPAEIPAAAKVKGFIAMGLGIASLVMIVVSIVNMYDSYYRGSYFLWFLSMVGMGFGIAAQAVSRSSLNATGRYFGPAKAGKVTGVLGVVFNAIFLAVGLILLTINYA